MKNSVLRVLDNLADRIPQNTFNNIMTIVFVTIIGTLILLAGMNN